MRAFAITLAALLLVTACGADRGEAPGAAIPRNEGGNADLHGVYIRNAYVAEGALFAVLINGGPQPDQLRRDLADSGKAPGKADL
ncbi:hypothetical protein [Nonomuraea sediminis]|uniref:hypothetical protein n=1 Tax=Nonomuraea sediminis TaxID=2835864 RepID=UPI001BDD7CB7|nr:hypothetical protein [Nonomuraea sediminis]